MPPISVLIKPSSGNCNMKCDYCFYCDEMENRIQSSYGFMTEETLKNIIRKTMLRAEGAILYAFQGGEPLLRGIDFFERLIELQNKYNKNHIRVNNVLQTNGYLLNNEWCRFFKKNGFLIGVSVDGTKAIHDGYRHTKAGADTYDTIVNHIKRMEQYDVDYNILTVVTKEVAENIKDIYYDYKTRGWHYQQYIECLDPLGTERGKEAYSLQPEVFGRFMTELFNLWYKDWRKGKQPYIRKFENYVAIMAGYIPESCEQRGCCGIQTVVEADGSAYPCDFFMMDAYLLGNFNKDRLPDMDKKREEIGFVERSKAVSSACRNCTYFYICRGGCQRNREWHTDEDGYRNYFCKGYKMFFDNCADRLLEIAKSL